MTKLTLSLILMLLPLHTFAGDFAGNGGDVVYCESSLPFTAKLLDFYEAQFFDPTYQVDLGADTLTFAEKANVYLTKLSRVNKVRAKFYGEELNRFFSKVLFVKDSELTDIPDSNHVGLPKNCTIKQIAIQGDFSNHSPGKKYIIDQDLWDSLDSENQVGLVFHEIIYREALKLGHKNSINSRILNAWIAGDDFSNVTQDEFNDFLYKIDFPTYDLLPSYPNLYLHKHYYDHKGRLSRAVVSHDSIIDFPTGEVPIKKGAKVKFSRKGHIESISCFARDKDGEIINRPTLENFELTLNGLKFAMDDSHCMKRGELKFYPTGVPRFLFYKSSHASEINYQTHQGTFPLVWGGRDSTISFQSNGKILQARLARETPFNLPNTKEFIFLDNYVTFHPDEGLEKSSTYKPFQIVVNAKTITIEPEGFGLHPNGTIWWADTKDTFEYIDGINRVELTDRINLAEDGRVTEGLVTAHQSLDLYGKKRALFKDHIFNFNGYEQKYEISVQNPEFYEVGLHSFTCADGYEGVWGTYTTFHSNWNFHSCQFNRDYKLHFLGKTYSGTFSGNHYGSVELYENGEVKFLNLHDARETFEVTVRNETYKVEMVALQPVGKIEKLRIMEDSVFHKANGELQWVKAKSLVTLDKNGFITSHQ